MTRFLLLGSPLTARLKRAAELEDYERWQDAAEEALGRYCDAVEDIHRFSAAKQIREKSNGKVEEITTPNKRKEQCRSCGEFSDEYECCGDLSYAASDTGFVPFDTPQPGQQQSPVCEWDCIPWLCRKCMLKAWDGAREIERMLGDGRWRIRQISENRHFWYPGRVR